MHCLLHHLLKGVKSTERLYTTTTATYFQNGMVTTTLKCNKMPYQLWHGEKPNLDYVRMFGCHIYVRIPDSEQKKLIKRHRSCGS